MGDKVFTTRESGEIYIQPDGPNTEPQFLGTCVDLDDISEDRGGIADLIQCFDGQGGWATLGATYSPPTPITLKLTTWLGVNLDLVERLVAQNKNCPTPVFIHKRNCGQAGVFSNWARSFVLNAQRITNTTVMGLAARNEDKVAEQSAELVALPPMIRNAQLVVQRQSTSEVNSANALAFVTSNRCGGPCGAAEDAGDRGMVAGDNTAAASANVLYTSNGATFAATATDPFAVNEIVSVLIKITVGSNTTRWIAGRGTTDAAAPAEIAYSDDAGATWTLVNVGSTNGQYFDSYQAIFALDQDNIWAVTTGGYIYKSTDAGLTWAAQESGVIVATDYNAVKFFDANTGYAVGDSNVVVKTSNGGATWSALTGPSAQAGVRINALAVPTEARVFLAYADGDLYYTENAGTTWAARTHPGSAVGQVRGIEFYSEFLGAMVRNTAAPVGTLLITEDGGYTWIALTTPTNVGLNALQIINGTLIWAVGEAQASTAVILKAYAP